MSLADIGIKETGGRNSVPTDRWVVASGQTELIEAGEPAKVTDDESEVILLVDADLTIGTDKTMSGIAAKSSTETSSASGYSDQFLPLPDVQWEVKAETSSTVDTQSEIDALIGNMVLINLASSVFTMEADATTGANNAFVIVGGDPNRSTVWFRIRLDASHLGRGTV